MNTATPVLEIVGLSAGYGPLTVLRNIDLTVHAGERVAVVGLNGHGKSTLFRAISGLTDWQRGSIRLAGRQIGRERVGGSGRDTHLIVARGLAHMSQGDAIFPGLSVQQHLDCGAHTRQAWRNRAQRREQLLDIFPPLRPLLKSLVGTLSGGERRMVSLARGLMVESRLYLIDEPSLGLAPKISIAMMEALSKIELRDAALVIAEQNTGLLQGHVTRQLTMHSGELDGAPLTTDVRA